MNAASIIRSKVVAVASVGFLGAGLLGGVAFAATPSTGDIATSVVPDARTALAHEDKNAGKLKAALDALVAKGIITQAQEDAIGAALKGEHRERGDHPKLREFVGDVVKGSVDYLGIPADQVNQQRMAGKSLGEIANATPTKSRTGLLNAVDLAAANRIQAAVTAGKLTQAQADQLTPKVNDAILKIVDHKRAPKSAAKN